MLYCFYALLLYIFYASDVILSIKSFCLLIGILGNAEFIQLLLSDKYDKLVIEAFGGNGDNDAEKEDKIIRNIAKEVTIHKNSIL